MKFRKLKKGTIPEHTILVNTMGKLINKGVVAFKMLLAIKEIKQD